MGDDLITRDDKLNTAEERGLPRLVALLFCAYGNITNDGKANILGIFDRIQPLPKNESNDIAFYLFVRTSNTEGPVHARIFDPNGKIVAGIEFQGDKPETFSGEPWYVQLLVPTAFSARSEGVHWVEVSYRGNVLGRAGLYVVLPQEEKRDVNDNSVEVGDQIQSV